MADQAKVVRDLMAACETLMDEVTGKRATDWGVVNDALVAGGRWIADHGGENAKANAG